MKVITVNEVFRIRSISESDEATEIKKDLNKLIKNLMVSKVFYGQEKPLAESGNPTSLT